MSTEQISWCDARKLTVEGRGWNQTDDFYTRLPRKAEPLVPELSWQMSRYSAGLVVRFVTDSDQISARWKLTSEDLPLPHMPATGVSGVDLYVRFEGKWRWLSVGKPLSVENEVLLIADPSLPHVNREYSLYLPLYNGVTSVEIGVKTGAVLSSAPPRTMNTKPVVVYGTSIDQGGCASRPGMCSTSIIGRRLDVPMINLGFSGSGTCEHEVSELLVELDPQVYVIACLPNMFVADVDERLRYLFKLLRQERPETPVILVENVIHQDSYLLSLNREPTCSKNRVLRRIYRDMIPDYGSKLFYVRCTKLYGNDGEGTVDGIHPTDVGFLRMADVLTPVIAKAIK